MLCMLKFSQNELEKINEGDEVRLVGHALTNVAANGSAPGVYV